MGDDTDLIYIIYWPDTDLCVQITGMPSNPASSTLCSQKHTLEEGVKNARKAIAEVDVALRVAKLEWLDLCQFPCSPSQ